MNRSELVAVKEATRKLRISRSPSSAASICCGRRDGTTGVTVVTDGAGCAVKAELASGGDPAPASGVAVGFSVMLSLGGEGEAPARPVGSDVMMRITPVVRSEESLVSYTNQSAQSFGTLCDRIPILWNEPDRMG